MIVAIVLVPILFFTWMHLHPLSLIAVSSLVILTGYLIDKREGVK